MVRGLYRAQLQQNLIAQILGGALTARTGEHVRERLGDEGLVAAPGAVLEVLADVRMLGLADLVAEVLLEVAPCLVAAAVSHFFAPGPAETMPRSCA